jgi:two-component system NtrC family response regulator
VENALESGKYNAFKFLSKPVDMDTLIQTIQAAYDHRVEKQSKQDSPDTSPAAKGPVSKLFQKFRHLYSVEK